MVKEYVNKIKSIIDTDKYLECSTENLYVIYVNGTIMGITLESKNIMEEIENFKNCGIFNDQVSYFIDDLEKEIRVFCDGGRYIRPVFTVEGKKLKIKPQDIKLSWRELVVQGYIKYIDSNEVEHSVIAMNISDLLQYPENPYKYCEIHPSAMLGVCSAVIPYSNHIQNPRLVYQSSMVKQALGIYALSYKNRFDTVAHVLHYPQKPLVGTRYDKMLKYDDMLTGCNPIVAIACYGSYNVEDSLIWNKASVDRGMFVHTCYKTITCEENKKTNNSIEVIEIPPEKLRTNGADYSKLGPSGVVVKGAHVYKGDIIIGKTITKSKKEDEDITEYSVAVGTGEEGIVDDVWDGYNEDGERMVKVKIRQLRIPEVGDKASSRSSQKGVCGIMLSQEDMPYTSQGIVPDLIMNPHCFTKDTPISLYSGLSKYISNMKSDGGECVWSHDKKSGLTSSYNLSSGCGGVKKIVKLTLEDGRTIRCTPDHKFYINGDWVEAQNIKLNQDNLSMGLEGVFDKNFGDEEYWKYDIFSMSSEIDREKSLAFARLLGYTLADGTICLTSRNEYRCNISFGTLTDAEICKKDIYLLSRMSPAISTNVSTIGKGTCFIVNVPSIITQIIVKLEGITIGRRTQQISTWPLILDSAPKSFVREFLAGLFGGDGHAPYLKGDHAQEIRFSQSTNKKYEKEFMAKMEKLCSYLNLFDVEACIERTRYVNSMNSTQDEMANIYIIVKNTLKFCEEIGMRYCIEKMYRLELYKSYKNLQNKVKAQSMELLNLVDDFYKSNTLEKSLLLAREELYTKRKNIPLNEYYSLGTKYQIESRRRSCRSKEVLHLSYKYFPTFKKYIEQLGVSKAYSSSEYFLERRASVLPTYNLKVLGRVEDGEENTWCFNVKDYNNFLACGITVTNSQPSRMSVSQLLECLSGKVASLSGNFVDSTTFCQSSTNPVETIANELQKYGFQKYGNERMYSGYTGEMLEASIFIGPTYYQRLKHLVKDKWHSRARGNTTLMHLQPNEGRANDGALRLGEMEKDVCISSGISRFLHESTFQLSDVYQIDVCGGCGNIISAEKSCRVCQDQPNPASKIGTVDIPYCAKLLFQELQSLGVKISIGIK